MEPSAAEVYAEITAECVRYTESDLVDPLARAIGASTRLCALFESELADHGVYTCWTEDVNAVMRSFNGDGTVAQASRDPAGLLRSLESTCNRLVGEYDELKPVHALWLRLDALQDKRPIFSLWQAQVRGALTAHRQATGSTGDQRQRRLGEAVERIKALIQMHPLAVEAHNVWSEVGTRLGDGDSKHPSLAMWRASVDGGAEAPVAALTASVATVGGASADVSDVLQEYRTAVARCRARVKEFDDLKEGLRHRRDELDGLNAKRIAELTSLTEMLKKANGATAHAASQRGSSTPFNTGRYGEAMSMFGSAGLLLGFVSCVSKIKSGLALDHLIVGGLGGVVAGFVIIAAMHLSASAEHSSKMSAQHQGALGDLAGARDRAVDAMNRAVALRADRAGVFLPSPALDAAIRGAQDAIDEAGRQLP